MIRSVVIVVWIIMVVFLKITARVSFILGILTIVASCVSILTGHHGFALRLTTYAFGFLVIGCVTYVLELKQHEKK